MFKNIIDKWTKQIHREMKYVPPKQLKGELAQIYRIYHVIVLTYKMSSGLGFQDSF